VTECPGFALELDLALCEAEFVAVIVTASSGEIVQIWTEVQIDDRSVILRQFSIYGVTVTKGQLGWALLRRMAAAAMEKFDVDCIRIEEARRTSGASPGRVIEALEFRRVGAQAVIESARPRVAKRSL
jgi:hypothetical protein